MLRRLLALLFLPAVALANEPPEWSGDPIAQIALIWPEGSEADDNLQPLLQSRQGAAADPGQVRRDVATLFRVGEFRAVEVDAVTVPYELDDGSVTSGVLLTFSVFPAPRVDEVRLGRVSGVRRSDVLDAARISVGQAYYAELDASPAARRVEAVYRRSGWPEADATLVEIEQDGRLTVFIDVEEGSPQTAVDVVFTGELPVSRARLRRWARQAGVREGRPVSEEAVTEAQFRIRQRLARLRTFPVQSGGWIEARVTPTMARLTDGTAQVAFTIEPGRQLRIASEGLRFRGNSRVARALSLDERTRLTRGFVAAAPERIEDALRRSGYLEATADVELDEPEDSDIQRLVVDIDRGPPHRLRTIAFHGNENIDATTLRLVMDQESDDVLRAGRVTRGEVEGALPAVRELYRSRGYLDAEVELGSIEVRNARGPFTALRQRDAKSVTVHINVDEGALSTLHRIEVEGEADGVDIRAITADADKLIDGPYSPQALAGVAQRLVDAHRREGYLEADVALQTAADSGVAVLRIHPGPQVRLRSIILRGAPRTRAQTVRREIDLTLGEPVTAGALEDVRRDLYDLGIFRTVTTELLGAGPLRDLVVSVEEQPRWAFELGGGVSTDQGFRGFGRATRRNLWGRAHRISLYGLVGLDWRSDSLSDWTPDFRDPEWRAAITYNAPHFPLQRQQVQADILLRERVQERTWQMSRSGLGLAVSTTLDARTTLRTGARLETRNLEEVDGGAILDQEPWAGLLDRNDPTLPSPARLQDSLTALLFHDRRDSRFAPTRGFSLSVRGEFAPGIPLGSGDKQPVRFVKTELRATGYLPLRGFVFRASGDFNRAFMLDDGIMALEDRYRLGGTGNLRGFRRDTLGPRNQIGNPDLGWSNALGPILGEAARLDPDRWTPTGGDTRVLGSFELIAPLPALGLRSWDGYAAAIFADVGNVWLLTDGVDATSESDAVRAVFDPVLRYSIGAGVRVATPIGPLQVDLAANPEAIAATGERKILLREQWREPLLRAHISLGTLF